MLFAVLQLGIKREMRRLVVLGQICPLLPLAALVAFPSLATAENEIQRNVVGDLWGVELLGRTPNYVDLGIGAFDIFTRDRHTSTSASARVELRVGEKLYGFGPLIGLMANTDGGVNGYGGLYVDLAVGDVVVTPIAAVSGYARGEGSDLGGVFLFRIGLGAAYEFENRLRIGVRLSHLSNASIHDDNPGEEEIYLTVALPF